MTLSHEQRDNYLERLRIEHESKQAPSPLVEAMYWVLRDLINSLAYQTEQAAKNRPAEELPKPDSEFQRRLGDHERCHRDDRKVWNAAIDAALECLAMTPNEPVYVAVEALKEPS